MIEDYSKLKLSLSSGFQRITGYITPGYFNEKTGYITPGYFNEELIYHP
jgi:hypothetical protein